MNFLRAVFLALGLSGALAVWAQPNGRGFGGDSRPPDGPPPGMEGGPPGFGRGGPGFGGFPGGPGMREDLKLLKQFDKDSSGWLNAEERQAARKYLAEQPRGAGRRGPGGPGGSRGPFGGFGGGANEAKPAPGIKVSPAQVKSYPEAPFYASNVLRTIFLEFDSADWEKELEEFHNTDVEVPAKLSIEGTSYSEVGVRFRGNTSYMFPGTGRKRPLNISLDMVHSSQNVMGFRTLNLLNGHEDLSFLHTVLGLQIARDYLAAPRANFVRLVINGENWGIYSNVEQFNKDFLRDRFGTTKGVRWKVPGSPGGRGGLEYLGNDVSDYRKVYEIKSKDEPAAWASLMKLCKVLNETPAEGLETKLGEVMDIDSALRFLAWDNVMAGGDGFWTRASDYQMYEDPRGQFHFFPYDVNESFSSGGGPRGPGGFGGRMSGPGGPGGPGGFGPGMFIAPQFLSAGDKDSDGKLSSEEFSALGDTWFDKIDTEKGGKVGQEQLVDGFNDLFPPPGDAIGFGPRGGGRGRFGPGMFLAPGFFAAANANKDDSLTRAEWKDLFAKWYKDWSDGKASGLDEEAVGDGLNKSLRRPEFGPGGGGPAGRRGPGGGGPGGPGRGGPTLDPLVSAKDTSKPLASKLLAVPALRARYLGYVRNIAETWLDWSKLGPLAKQYQALISAELKADTKKLYPFEQFEAAIDGSGEGSLKTFAAKRREYLLSHPEVKAAKSLAAR